MRIVSSSGPVSVAKLLLAQLLAGLVLSVTSGYAAIFTVINAGDSGGGSLRQAILNANTNADLDTIEFQIPGTGPFTISLATPLPALAFPTIINATTQSGYAGQPLVELNGQSAGSALGGLQLSGGNSTIRGLAINRFNGSGILVSSSGNTIQANCIGTDVTGAIVRPNAQPGIYVLNNNNNLIGGTHATNRNVISGNSNDGIYIQNGSGNVVQGNYIGLNAAGTADLGNGNNGVVIYDLDGLVTSSNLIGGAVGGARNVISGNTGSGISLFGPGASGNLLQGNLIGLNAAGTGSISNNGDGITLDNAPANFIGGTNSGARNVISGNGRAGIFLSGTSARANRIEGNYVGTDLTGLLALGNARSGLLLSTAPTNYIGGSVSGAMNLISGNKQDGIFITNSPGNHIRGNVIGLKLGGTVALPNIDSGLSLDNSPGNLVGGSAPGEGNIISGNGGIGVWLRNVFAVGNQIKGNYIGTSAAGTSAVGNTIAGLGISDAPGNLIGGTTAGERNIISGNGILNKNGGVFLMGGGASGNLLIGNYLGVDVSGMNPLGNFYEGIYLESCYSNLIGSPISGGGNVISANGTRAVMLTNASWNTLQGNLIGTAADGETGMNNGYAFPGNSGFSLIEITNSSNNTIGGTDDGAGNRIGFAPVLLGSYYAGVRVRDGSVNNAILGNAIFSNGGLGIDVGNYGITVNDPFAACDGDTGGNQRQNFPVLLDAVSGSNTRVRGYLHSASGQSYRIQFFSNATCDTSPAFSGYGEGKKFLGQTTVILGGICSNNFSAVLVGNVSEGSVITATATDAANNTSELSACVTVSTTPRLNIATINATQLSVAWTNTTTPGFALKQTTNLSPPVAWSPVTNLPVNIGGQFIVTLPRQPGNRFYVLSFE